MLLMIDAAVDIFVIFFATPLPLPLHYDLRYASLIFTPIITLRCRFRRRHTSIALCLLDAAATRQMLIDSATYRWRVGYVATLSIAEAAHKICLIHIATALRYYCRHATLRALLRYADVFRRHATSRYSACHADDDAR